MPSRRKFLIETTLTAGALLTKPLNGLTTTNVASSVKNLSIIDLHSETASYHVLNRISSHSKSTSLIFATPRVSFDKTLSNEQVNQLKQYGCDVVLNERGFNDEKANEYLTVTRGMLPYTILRKGEIKIGIIRSDVEDFTLLKNPGKRINETATYLRAVHACHLIVAVHPELNTNSKRRYFDKELVAFTKGIDVIISKNNPVNRCRTYVAKNAERNEVIIISQGKEVSVTKAIDISFNHRKEKINIAIRPVFA